MSSRVERRSRATPLAELRNNLTKWEMIANDILVDFKNQDILNCYGNKSPSEWYFLRYRTRINASKTFKILNGLPKAAHHHIHFNSGLDVLFLVKKARRVQDMYIKSDIALTNANDLYNCKIQFDVMTEEKANQINIQTAGAGKMKNVEAARKKLAFAQGSQGRAEIEGARNELAVAEDKVRKAMDRAVQVQQIDQAMRIFFASQNGNIRPYIDNSWIKYQHFQELFQRKFRTDSGLRRQLQMADIDKNDQYSRSIEADTLLVEEWLASKLVFTQEDINIGYDRAWDKFNAITPMTKGLFSYEEAFRAYTRYFVFHCVRQLNLSHVEIRPNFMKNNQLKRAGNRAETIDNKELVTIIKGETDNAIQQLYSKGHLYGASQGRPGKSFSLKIIYCTPRWLPSFLTRSFGFDSEQARIKDALDECRRLYMDFGSLICGFDMVGQENKRIEVSNGSGRVETQLVGKLQDFQSQFIEFQILTNGRIPFLFHCGEATNGALWENLQFAASLNTRRIGHGCSLTNEKNRALLKLFIAHDIGIESCPTSNEILGACRTIDTHMFKTFVRYDVPFSVSSDNMTPFRSSPNHEFFQILVGSRQSDLVTLKKLALDSLSYSCLEPGELQTLTREWEVTWKEFCFNMIRKYGTSDQIKLLDSLEYAATSGSSRT